MDGSSCDGPGSSIILNQEGVSKAVAQNFAKNLVEEIQKTKAYQDVEQEVKSKLVQENEGLSLAGLMASLGLTALGPLGPCVLVCLCVCCLAGPAIMKEGTAGAMEFRFGEEDLAKWGPRLLLVFGIIIVVMYFLEEEGFCGSCNEGVVESDAPSSDSDSDSVSDTASISTFSSSLSDGSYNEDYEEDFSYDRRDGAEGYAHSATLSGTSDGDTYDRRTPLEGWNW